MAKTRKTTKKVEKEVKVAEEKKELTPTQKAADVESGKGAEATSVNELNEMAKEVKDDSVSEVEEMKEIEEVEVEKELSIDDIVNDDSIPLMQRIAEVVNRLSSPGKELANSIVLLHNFGLTVHTTNRENYNSEQKSIVRHFKMLVEEGVSEFTEQFRYVNWIYKSLTDLELLKENDIPTKFGASLLDTINSSLFAAGSDDEELYAFVYLLTIMDMRNKGIKKVSVAKATQSHCLTEDEISTLVEFYDEIA